MVAREKAKLVIYGLEVEADVGMSIMEVARANDVYIPHLCYHPDLEPVGACRMCMVDVGGRMVRTLVDGVIDREQRAPHVPDEVEEPAGGQIEHRADEPRDAQAEKDDASESLGEKDVQLSPARHPEAQIPEGQQDQAVGEGGVPDEDQGEGPDEGVDPDLGQEASEDRRHCDRGRVVRGGQPEEEGKERRLD